MRESQGHAKSRCRRLQDEAAMAQLNDMVDDRPWKVKKRLFELLPVIPYIRGACDSLTVVHNVRHFIEEARFGARTVAEIEQSCVCRRKACQGRIMIDRVKRGL